MVNAYRRLDFVVLLVVFAHSSATLEPPFTASNYPRISAGNGSRLGSQEFELFKNVASAYNCAVKCHDDRRFVTIVV